MRRKEDTAASEPYFFFVGDFAGRVKVSRPDGEVDGPGNPGAGDPGAISGGLPAGVVGRNLLDFSAVSRRVT